MPQPVVAIVGRPNVGKSSLLNSLVGMRVSIVQDMPGVTRDRISVPMKVGGKYIELVDTGGYGFEDEQGLTEHIRRQIEHAMRRADLVIFVIDVQDELTAVDMQVVELLRKLNKPVILLANKADNDRDEIRAAELSRLGFGNPIAVSATTKRNLGEVRDRIESMVNLEDAPEEPSISELMIAIVGKRNAGKSTFVNAVAKLYNEDEERVIVSEVAGTTRDSVDVMFTKDGKTLTVIDTAGVRKKRHMVTNDLEFYSFHRAERSIRRADVVLLLLDATEVLSEPDKKLAQSISEQHKPLVIVINKWDKALQILHEKRGGTSKHEPDFKEEFFEYLWGQLPTLSFAPVVFVTAKDGKGVAATVDIARNLQKRSSERVGTGVLNRAMQQVLTERSPSSKSGRRPRVYYLTQVDVSPPSFALFVNDHRIFDDSYRRFITNRLRELLPFDNVPIVLHVRSRVSQEAPPEIKRKNAGKSRAPANLHRNRR